MKDELLPFIVRYSASDLERLRQIEDQTRVNGREYLRALLAAFVQAYARRGSISLPLAVVSREEAIEHGLLKPEQSRPEQNLQHPSSPAHPRIAKQTSKRLGAEILKDKTEKST
jgi:hypothetical protein